MHDLWQGFRVETREKAKDFSISFPGLCQPTSARSPGELEEKADDKKGSEESDEKASNEQ